MPRPPTQGWMGYATAPLPRWIPDARNPKCFLSYSEDKKTYNSMQILRWWMKGLRCGLINLHQFLIILTSFRKNIACMYILIKSSLWPSVVNSAFKPFFIFWNWKRIFSIWLYWKTSLTFYVTEKPLQSINFVEPFSPLVTKPKYVNF